MTKLRLVNWRPVGAVDCPRCGKFKASGGYYRVENMTAGTTRKELMCDSCKQTFKEWYEAREDESGVVVIDD